MICDSSIFCLCFRDWHSDCGSIGALALGSGFCAGGDQRSDDWRSDCDSGCGFGFGFDCGSDCTLNASDCDFGDHEGCGCGFDSD